jgi:hypothetical protein
MKIRDEWSQIGQFIEDDYEMVDISGDIRQKPLLIHQLSRSQVKVTVIGSKKRDNVGMY